MTRLVTLSVILISLVCFSCDLGNAESNTANRGTDFYPIDSGYSWIYYVVDSDLGLDSVRTDNYYLKEVIGEQIDLDGDLRNKLYRYKKVDEEWVLDSVWTISKSTSKVLRYENDAALTTMIFPISNNKQWDVNALNTRDEDLYTYELYYDAYSTDSLDFDTTVTITQSEDSDNNLIETDNRYEIYAKGIGLVEKYSEVTSTQPGEASVGRIFKQTLVDYEQ